MAEKKKYPPNGSRCAICGAKLECYKLHAWAEGRKRKGFVTHRAFICPVCETKGRGDGK